MTKDAVIYIHIPFCIKHNPCVPAKSIIGDSATKHRYMDALRQEIDGALSTMEDYRITAIYVGGGSPSIMNPDDIRSLLQHLRQNVNLKQGFELSMEVLPQTVGTPSLEGMKAGGVNRICFAMLSAKNSELASLDCGFSLSDIDLAMAYIAEFGFRNLDFSLAVDFPGQTETSLSRTLQVAKTYSPGHITLAVPTGKGTASDEPSMANLARGVLEQAGYREYADRRFAKPGKECAYLLTKYSGSDYFGFGVGARSLMGDVVCTNTTDLKTYLDHASSYELIAAQVESLTPEQRKSYVDAVRRQILVPTALGPVRATA